MAGSPRQRPRIAATCRAGGAGAVSDSAIERRLDPLAAFLARLAQGYAPGTVQRGGELPAELGPSLLLAGASLHDLGSLRARPERVPQIAVMGPTQVGKSTVVNLLVGAEVAEVSPLAGFTVHPGAFVIGPAASDQDWLEGFFPGWTRSAVNTLSPERLDAYGVMQVEASDPASVVLQDCVVWDTPDFDSLASRRYRQGVLEVAAMADVIVLVLSREKYADLSVWRTLELLAPLERRFVVCLNKSTPEAEAVIVPALCTRLETLEPQLGRVPIVSLPLWESGQIPARTRDDPTVIALRETVEQAVRSAERRARPAAAQALMRTHWEQWTAPVHAELAARQEWLSSVQFAAHAALDAYRSEYLDHPQRYDSLRRAVAALLGLLEIPGIAAAMMRLRRIVTWPARQLIRTWRGRRANTGTAAAELSNEQRVLRDVLDQQLLALSRDVARRKATDGAAVGFWRALDERLADEQPRLLAGFHQAAQAHEQAVADEIQASAHRLYEHLREHPAILNTLRATRASADAAAIAIAVKLGGVGVNDLLLAPALISVTSLLTEGALGSYVQHEIARLKRRQARIVEQQVIDAAVIPALAALADGLHGPGVLGIPAAELEAAEAAIEELGHA
jgi:GTPase SAR1 family protein